MYGPCSTSLIQIRKVVIVTPSGEGGAVKKCKNFPVVTVVKKCRNVERQKGTRQT